MKKILMILLLGFVVINLNLLAKNTKQELIKEKTKTHFTKMDCAKISFASLGCLFFSYFSIMTYHMYKLEFSTDFTIFHILPNFLASRVKLFLEVLEFEFAGSRAVKLVGTTSGLLATILAIYVCKKLYALKSKKLAESTNN